MKWKCNSILQGNYIDPRMRTYVTHFQMFIYAYICLLETLNMHEYYCQVIHVKYLYDYTDDSFMKTEMRQS